MATNWTYESGSSTQSFSLTTAAVTASPTPQPGDLMILSWGGTRATAFTSAAPTDTGSGGWASIPPGFQTRSTLTSQSWWKVATAADASATITVTGSGGSGAILVGIECDIFRLPRPSVISIDISGGATPTATTSTSWHPSSGSSYPNFTDALAYAIATSAANRGSVTGTNTFTGTSSAANLTAVYTGSTNNYINGEYVGGVQANATAASNTWALAWTNSVGPNVLGVTFVYVPTSGSTLLSLGVG